jgi:hypothetical protein
MSGSESSAFNATDANLRPSKIRSITRCSGRFGVPYAQAGYHEAVIRARVFFVLLILAALTVSTGAQQPPVQDRDRLPNGKSRKLELIKHEHAKSLEDVAEIIALAQELEAEMERNTEHVVSLESLRKAEQIESLSKRLQRRMKRQY